MAMSAWTLILTAMFLSDHVSSKLYTNQIAVKVEGGLGMAHEVAKRHGFVNKGQIGSLEDHYLFEHPRILKRSASPSDEHRQNLEQESQVQWFEQQHVLIRTNREVRDPSWKMVRKWNATSPSQKDPRFTINDPAWGWMWYLNRSGLNMDMNVIPAWKMGYSGKGVVVTILNDGLERNHSDLIRNYDPAASYDYNSHDADPKPRYTYNNVNKLGTQCAGVVAAMANNSRCGLGIAFNANIGGIRMLDGDVTDSVEAASLSHNPQHIDIYSASWGPRNDGRTVDGPGMLAKRALIQGITKGRGGKGSIFIWSAGNGGWFNDSCNCDGYTNSPFTLSITSVTSTQNKPAYTKNCLSIMAATYSGGFEYRRGIRLLMPIVTTGLHNKCVNNFTGSAVSDAIATGIVALVLEANPSLNWRDVQHITQRNARPFNDGQWVKNGRGIPVSPSYGFGLMDATGMVLDAINWTHVPEQLSCDIHPAVHNISLNGTGFQSSVHAYICTGNNFVMRDNDIRYLEHVQVNLALNYTRRGQLGITLTSPSGTVSTLLSYRPLDNSNQGFRHWTFMSVQFWGEDPRGQWILTITDGEKASRNKGILYYWSLKLYGTSEDPATAIKYPWWKWPSSTNVPIVNTSAWTSTQQPRVSNRMFYTTTAKRNSTWRYTASFTKPTPSWPQQPHVNHSTPGHTSVNRNSTWKYTSSFTKPTPSWPQPPHVGHSTADLTSVKGNSSWKHATSTTKPTSSWPQFRCHSECANGCHGPRDTDCVDCVHTRMFRKTAFSYEIVCVSSCQERHFVNASNLCTRCHPSCQTCHGPEATDCLTCLDRLLMLVDHQLCVYTCPAGYFRGPDYCAKCAPGLSLVGGECVRKEPVKHGRCDDGKYFDGLRKVCSPCHSHCTKCFGPGINNCLECSPGMGYHEESGQCKYCCASESPHCCICDETTRTCIVNTGHAQAMKEGYYVVHTQTIIPIVCLICVLLIVTIVATLLLLRYKHRLCWAVTKDDNYKNDKITKDKEGNVYTIITDVHKTDKI